MYGIGKGIGLLRSLKPFNRSRAQGPNRVVVYQVHSGVTMCLLLSSICNRHQC